MRVSLAGCPSVKRSSVEWLATARAGADVSVSEVAYARVVRGALIVGLVVLSSVSCASIPRRLARGRVEEACELATGGADRRAWTAHVASSRVVFSIEPLSGEALEARFGLRAREEGHHLLHVRWAVDRLPEGVTATELTLRLSALGQTAGAHLASGVQGDLRDVFAAPRLLIDEPEPYVPAPFEPPPRPTVERRGTPGRPHPVERIANDLLAAFSLGAFRAGDEPQPPLTPESSRALGVWLEEVRAARVQYEAAESERRAAHDAHVEAAHDANEAARAAHELAIAAHHDALAALAGELAFPRCEGDVTTGIRCDGYAIWSAPPSEPEAVTVWAHLDLHFGACTWHLVGDAAGEPAAHWEDVLAELASAPRTIPLGSLH